MCFLVFRFREVASRERSFASARDHSRRNSPSQERKYLVDSFEKIYRYNTSDSSFSCRDLSLQISRVFPSTSGKNPRCLAVSVAQSIVQSELTCEKLGSLGEIWDVIWSSCGCFLLFG